MAVVQDAYEVRSELHGHLYFVHFWLSFAGRFFQDCRFVGFARADDLKNPVLE